MKNELLNRLENSAAFYDLDVYGDEDCTFIDVTVTDEDCAEYHELIAFLAAHDAEKVSTSYPVEYQCNNIVLAIYTQEREEYEYECC